ncbi:YdiU family protein [Tistrella mobilis]|uniref:protein adenylyltransferase SelO n=1 Tax=Tistrella mobilis TaxID=171437 RepID=UPI00355785FB
MTALTWRFDNSYARLPGAFYTRQGPTPVEAPVMVMFNHGLADALGLVPPGGIDDRSPELAALFAGNRLPDGAEPLAQAYAGHQFGGFTMLGDGRAIVLGEHLTPDGHRVDIQFKGSGPTPYSRMGDGRAALGPMLREYLISEAMHGLGIPTTRSLAVVATGEPVYREEVLAGAILTRVAASHLRVGTFQYAAARHDVAGLKALLDYAIARHDPDAALDRVPALALLDHVIRRQAALIVDWMRVGFVHGVMNTDNMTISGETIDYGPCAFIDAHDPAMVFSSIDRGGRYAYGNQPAIAQWNLARLAGALLPLIDDDQEAAVAVAQERIQGFEALYTTAWQAMMRRKLGLVSEQPGDAALIGDLVAWMVDRGADHTLTFRHLTTGTLPEGGVWADEGFRSWHARWCSRRAADDAPEAEQQAAMAAANPVYIPRNHQVEMALAAVTEEGNLTPFRRLLEVVSRPYEARDGLDAYEAPPPVGSGRYRTFCGT